MFVFLFTATCDRSRSPDVKKNVLFRMTGPPKPQAVSLRLKSACLKFGIRFWNWFFPCIESFV
jgi:hypothetical protein